MKECIGRDENLFLDKHVNLISLTTEEFVD